MTTSPHLAAEERELPTVARIPKDTTAEPTEPRAAKARPTVARIPKDTTAEPTEPQAAKARPTVARIPKDTTAVQTERPDRLSVLSRCIATDPQTFATEYWGRRPLLSPSEALPRDFGDLLSPDTVDELIAERGVRAPFIRLANEGDVLAKDCYLGPAGFGAEMGDQVDSAKVLAQFATGATIVLQGLHRLWPPLIDFVRQAVDELGHPVQANAYITPPANRGFDPATITTSTTSSSYRHPDRSVWDRARARPCPSTAVAAVDTGYSGRDREARNRQPGPMTRCCGRRATRCICRGDGSIRHRRWRPRPSISPSAFLL